MEKDKHFQMRASQSFLDLIDDWRRKQPEIPSRAEAIRSLVMNGVCFNIGELGQLLKTLPQIVDTDSLDDESSLALIKVAKRLTDGFTAILELDPSRVKIHELKEIDEAVKQLHLSFDDEALKKPFKNDGPSPYD